MWLFNEKLLQAKFLEFKLHFVIFTERAFGIFGSLPKGFLLARKHYEEGITRMGCALAPCKRETLPCLVILLAWLSESLQLAPLSFVPMSTHNSHHARTRAHKKRRGRKSLCISHLSGFCSNTETKASVFETIDALAAPRSMVMSQQVHPYAAHF